MLSSSRSDQDYAKAIIPYLKSLNLDDEQHITGSVSIVPGAGQYRIVLEPYAAAKFLSFIDKRSIQTTIKREDYPSNNMIIELSEAHYKRIIKPELDAFLDDAKKAAEAKTRQSTATENASSLTTATAGLSSSHRSSRSYSSRSSVSRPGPSAAAPFAVPASKHQRPSECKPIGLILGVTAGVILLAVCVTHPVIALYLLKQCLPTAFTSTLSPTTAIGATTGAGGFALTTGIGALVDCCIFSGSRRKRKIISVPAPAAARSYNNTHA